MKIVIFYATSNFMAIAPILPIHWYATLKAKFEEIYENLGTMTTFL